MQALQEARIRSEAAAAEVQRISKEVKRLEVGIPKLQLEAAAARHQSTDLQQRLSQLAQAAQVQLAHSCGLRLSRSDVISCICRVWLCCPAVLGKHCLISVLRYTALRGFTSA